MPSRRLKDWLAGLAFVAGGCLATAGCHTSPLTAVASPEPAPKVRLAGPDARSDPAARPLGPQMVLKWKITAPAGQQLPPVSGESIVGGDGRVDLGPYGVVAVGGLTTKQASDAIAKHVGKFLPGARIHLAAYMRPAQQQAARPASSGGMVVRGQQPAPAPAAPAEDTGPALTQTAYQSDAAPDQPLNLAVPEDTPPATAAEVIPLAAAEAPPPDKPAEKETPGDTGKKDQATENNSQAKTEVAAAGPLYPPPGGPFPGHAPNELHKISLPAYVVEPPDILLVQYHGTEQIFTDVQVVAGQHLVRPDGTISLGIYGDVPVAGLTLEQVRQAVYAKLNERTKLDPKVLEVDVLAYNSKVYYVITDGAGFGEPIYRFPITGSECVLDALSQIGGLPPQASKVRVWVARRTPHGAPCILPVDYVGVTKAGYASTNYQIMPGDRVYVAADPWRTADTLIAKWLSPVERIFGATLLGAETVTAVRNAAHANGGGNGINR
jgi:polysaccharide export outer membrane protein